ncbi:MAG: hypothetical protein LUE22_03860 [Oscillospiraceae bacterium]|nr:hypothetical protein [Oscillospiraceae bacterium]
MAKKGESKPGIFGSVNHYDEHGHKIGHSDPGLFGGYTHYDSKGHKTGHSDPGFFGGYDHYDSHDHKTGHSDPNIFGSYSHIDSSGKRTGSSDPNLFGGYSHNDNQGCYVATCVYGSYDCPQVWTLRRFRDNTLAQTRPGRCFIHIYYAISPTIVKWFGNTGWFQRMWRGVLNRIVAKLQHKGVKNTPYKDRDWR